MYVSNNYYFLGSHGSDKQGAKLIVFHMKVVATFEQLEIWNMKKKYEDFKIRRFPALNSF